MGHSSLSKDLQNSTGQRRGFSFRYPTLFLQSINQFYVEVVLGHQECNIAVLECFTGLRRYHEDCAVSLQKLHLRFKVLTPETQVVKPPTSLRHSSNRGVGTRCLDELDR